MDVNNACLPPKQLCDDLCVDPSSNMSNCGQCNNNCAANMGARIDSCSNGLCVCAAESGVPCLSQQYCTTKGCEAECPPAQQCGPSCCVVSDSCIDNACCPAAQACDDTCCSSGDACAGGACCSAAQACGDTCCNSGKACVSGACCDSGNICGDACCAGDQTCIGGACCSAEQSCGDVCCGANESCVDGSCCPDNMTCNGACCSGDQTCVDNTCCPAAQICDTACCATGESCSDGVCCSAANQCGVDCCGSGESCISNACCPDERVCNGACCAAGDVCVDGQCCPSDKACGSACCATNEFCFYWICTAPTPGITVLYATTLSYDGDLGGRSGADAKCATEKPDDVTCQAIAALISVNVDDEIQDLTGPPNSFVASQPVYFFDRNSHHFTPCADTWTKALDPGATPLLYNVKQGTGESFYENYWTGSTLTGGYASAGIWDYTCNGWTTTSTTENYLGTQGDPDDLVDWLHSSQNYLSCTRELHLLCACKL